MMYDKGNKHTAIPHLWYIQVKNANAINELEVIPRTDLTFS